MTDNDSPSYGGAGKRRAGRTPMSRRRKLLVIAFACLVLVPALGIASYAYILNSKLGNIDKVDKSLPDTDRPDPDKGKAINILLIGSDKGKKIPGESAKTSIAEDAQADTWPVGKYRSDTLMVVHITSNRKYAFLTSIPRDTLTTLYDEQGEPQGMAKINDAFSRFGPLGAQATVEQLTGIRMRHFAIIDWAGFKDLSSAVGGVPVTIPRSFYDPQQKIQWNAGEQVLKGEKALSYVRTRYGLLRGDFDRIARQQNFLRALMKKLLAQGVMSNPVKLVKSVSALTENLTVDGDWSSGDMRGLALGLRGISTDDVIFLTAPVAGTETVNPYGSIVRLDEAKTAELFEAYRKDNLRGYLKKYPDDVLKQEVS